LHRLRSTLGLAIAFLLCGHAVWVGTAALLSPLPPYLECYCIEAREKVLKPEDEAALHEVVPGNAKVLLTTGMSEFADAHRAMWIIHGLLPAIPTLAPQDGFDFVLYDPQTMTDAERERCLALADDFRVLLEFDSGLVVLEPRKD